ncbi:MAG: hypothetical protein VW830_03080, partial [Rhodobiaceae bacterium]
MAAAETPTMMMDRLSDAVWQMLAEQSPRAIHIDDVADAAGVAPAAARAAAGRIMARFHQKQQRRVRPAGVETQAE